MKKFMTGLSLLALASTATGGTNIQGQQITYIGTGWGGEAVYIDTLHSNTTGGCGPRYAIDTLDARSNAMRKEMETILLSAFHNNSIVDIYVDGCFNNHMAIKAVAIRK